MTYESIKKELLKDITIFLNDKNERHNKEQALAHGYAIIDELKSMKYIKPNQAKQLKRQFNYWLYHVYKPIE